MHRVIFKCFLFLVNFLFTSLRSTTGNFGPGCSQNEVSADTVAITEGAPARESTSESSNDDMPLSQMQSKGDLKTNGFVAVFFLSNYFSCIHTVLRRITLI